MTTEAGQVGGVTPMTAARRLELVADPADELQVALGEARAAADPVALAEALSIAHHCLLGPDHVQLRSQLAVELTKVSMRTQRHHLAAGFVVSAIEVMLAGHLDDAESLAASCAKSGVAAGDVDNEWWSAAQLVTVRWYQGRLVELLPMLRVRAHSPVLSAVDDSSAAALAVAAALDGTVRTGARCSYWPG